MNMKRARRKHPSGAGSFRTWVRDVVRKFGEIQGDNNFTGKLAHILGIKKKR